MLNSFLQWLEFSELGSFIAASEWAFPTIETFHVIAIVTVLGSIVIMDLRLLGLTSKDQSVTTLSRDTLPLTWVAFVVAVITGVLMFVSKATTYVVNPYFLVKMGLIVLAGVNMGVLHFLNWKNVSLWDNGQAPTAVKVAGGLSLFFWLVVVFLGRMIGFTLGMYTPTF